MKFSLENAKIGIIGLGYVGLPLAVEFGKQFETLGFDINETRVAELISGHDTTLECSPEELREAKHLTYSLNEDTLKSCNVYIITVPTPIDEHKQPDLTALLKASEMVGKMVTTDDIIIYESTVYPGATEEDCLPVVEKVSGLTLNQDFYAGYSPERINPGDKEHRLTNILKVTSGSTKEVADYIDMIYRRIIKAGTYQASSIKVAEAAKISENTQRDVNIALINELSIIFNKLGIDTHEVLEAASTKWNFLPFKPGLVGGHCIGVDPYYLTHKAQASGYIPDMIISARRINDGMGEFVVSQLVKAMLKKRIQVDGAKILVMGLAFKENCADTRNTKILDIINGAQEYNMETDVYDPWCDPDKAHNELGISLVRYPCSNKYDAVILAVAHDNFRELSADRIRKFCKAEHIIYDLKYLYPKTDVDIRL